MIDLHLHGWKVNTVFDLLGETENDITFSVGWGLARCEPFLGALLQSVFGENSAGDPRSINLQRHAEDGGYTDIEITTSRAYLIVEAKRGWSLPGEDQLRRYTKRFHQNSLKRGLLVLSECTPEFAQDNLPPQDPQNPCPLPELETTFVFSAPKRPKRSPRRQKTTSRVMPTPHEECRLVGAIPAQEPM